MCTKIKVFIVCMTIATTISAMPSLPDDVKHAVWNVHTTKHYELLHDYIATSSRENLVVLDLLLNEVTDLIHTAKVFRFGYRNVIVGMLILGWGTCSAGFTAYTAASRQDKLIYAPAHEKTLVAEQSSLPSVRISLAKLFLAASKRWMLKHGLFVAIVTALPSIFAECNYYAHHYHEQETRISQLRYEIAMRYLQRE